MHLIKVDYVQVLADLQLQHPTEFNTSFHTAEEAPHYERPSEEPYSFKRWLALILQSRGLRLESMQTIPFSRREARLLLDAAEASIQTRTVNRMFREDIDEEIIPKFSSLKFPKEGLFMRLNACSAKDGARKNPQITSLHSAEEIVLLLVTSIRARNALFKCMETGEQFELFFLPFDLRMRSENEYRVFCPPDGSTISGISQYQWHKRWKHADQTTEDAQQLMRNISHGCEALRLQILQALRSDDETDNLLLKQGFSFDVLFDDQTKQCELIELNVFGTRNHVQF
ncbi:hypothetical protein TruAng_010623 [Truncatella angustata]|nr:hypothetical protein TruAng_010623 [Truncatella angustata]